MFEFLPEASLFALLISLVEWTVRIGLAMRVISKRTNVSESLAWIGILLLLPVGGIFLYLWFGEHFVWRRGRAWQKRISPPVGRWLQDIAPRAVRNWSVDEREERGLATLIGATIGLPAIGGNDLRLLHTADTMSEALIADIQAAEHYCFLEFYIWEEGGTTDDLVDAIVDACKRNVDCRILVDHLGSRRFSRSKSAQRLREAGAQVKTAMRINWLLAWLHRFDMRLHRKIVVIDGDIGYTGSQNMADPKLFKKSAGVGQWVDAMVRVQGEASEGLLATFLADWEAETGEGIELLETAMKPPRQWEQDGAVVQVIPTDPLLDRDAAKQIVINMLFAARSQLVLTTPYYVPDQALQSALMAAAQRGVDVTLIVPRKVDSKLVAIASDPFQLDLIQAGVRVLLYDGGLLHTKSITVDDRVSLFGSLNLDLRSFHLNFEISLAIYDEKFTGRLRRLQQTYMQDSTPKIALASRGWLPFRVFENAVRLLAPLL